MAGPANEKIFLCELCGSVVKLGDDDGVIGFKQDVLLQVIP